MLQNFIISVEAVAPMFIIMAVGVWLKQPENQSVHTMYRRSVDERPSDEE